jgi:hypothetical protein
VAAIRPQISTQVFFKIKTIGSNRFKLPLLLDDCMDAGGRATHGAVAERVGERGNNT